MINAGENIKRLREEAGLTQKELANKIYIEQHSLSQYERGKRRISVEMFEEIVNALGVEIELKYRHISNPVPVTVNVEAEKNFNTWNSMEEACPGWIIEMTGGQVYVASRNIRTKSGQSIGVWIGNDGMCINYRLVKDPKFGYDIVEDEYISIEEEDEEVSGIPYWDYQDMTCEPVAWLQENGWDFTSTAKDLFTENDFENFVHVAKQL